MLEARPFPCSFTLRRQYPPPFRRGILLQLSVEPLLMRPEIGDTLPDLLAIARFDDGARHWGLASKALRKRHRLFDERIKFSFPIGHGNSPSANPSGPSPAPPE